MPMPAPIAARPAPMPAPSMAPEPVYAGLYPAADCAAACSRGRMAIVVLQSETVRIHCSAPTAPRGSGGGGRCPSSSPGAQRASPDARPDTRGARGAGARRIPRPTSIIEPLRGSMMCCPDLTDEHRREQREDERLDERDQDFENHDAERHQHRRRREEPAEHEDQPD